jgi:type I restriction enzyme S subunit
METPEETILPKSWMWTRLGEIIEKIPLTNKKLKQKEYQQEGKLPVIDQGQVFIGGYTDKEDLKISCVSSLIIFGGHTKVVKFVNFDFVAGADGVKVIRPQKVYNPKLFYFFIQAIPLPNKVYARHFQFLEKSSIPLPPLAEQHRIVTKIEELFTQLDAGVEGLKKIQVQLKRYRQSVLKSACEGRLVPTEAELARAEGRDYEPADVLLERILGERRRKWEENNKGLKGKYKEPAAPDDDDLINLTEGWCWISLDQILTRILAGKSFKCEERPPNQNEFGIVKVSAVTWGVFNEIESKTCKDPEKFNKDFLLKKGDFLFSRANTIDLVGACVIVKSISKSLMLSDKIHRFDISLIPTKWVLYNLRTSFGRSEIERLATGNQNSMRNIGQDRIRRIRIPLPPLAEQHRIVAEIERRLSVADEIENTIDHNLKQAERLRQSILKKAFRGKLVPQNPDDEPASVLLEKIQKERTQKKKVKKSG